MKIRWLTKSTGATDRSWFRAIRSMQLGCNWRPREFRKKIEQYLARKAEGMVETVLGPGQAVVRVPAEMNFDTSTRVEEKFDPDSVVARSTTENEETTD